MRYLINIFCAVAFLFQSCTREDKHPTVVTLEKLIQNGDVTFIEKKDSVSLFPFIIFLNDSVYITQSPQHHYSETKTLANNKTAGDDLVIKNSFALKNIFNGKIYHTETLDSRSSVLVNKRNDVIINDIMYLAPDYSSKIKADTLSAMNVTDLKVDEKLNKLNEFDESIINKWTNNGRLGTLHEIFYYQLGGKKFKSTSECYLIQQKGKYFYNSKLGILKFK